MKRSSWIVVLLIAAGATYAALLPRYDVGYYTDDADYILAARSIRAAAVHDHFPGYAFALSPWVKIVQPHWPLLKLISLVATLLSCFLMWCLLAPYLSFGPRFIGVVLFAFNPTTANFAVSVMPEPFSLAMLLGIFVVLENLLLHEKPPVPSWLLGLMAGWCLLIRPENIVLIPCIAFCLAAPKTRAYLLPALGISLAVWMSVLLPKYFLAGHPQAGYLQQFLASTAYLQGPDNLLSRNVLEVLNTLWLKDIFPIPFFAGTWERSFLLGLLSLAGTGFTVLGFIRFCRRVDALKPLSMGIGLFCCLYLTAHVFWLAVDPRYFLPLIPFILAALMGGVESAYDRFGLPLRAVLWSAGFLVIIGYVYQDGFALAQAFRGAPENRIPRETFSWVKTHTAKDSLFLAPNRPVVFLYTERPALSFLAARDIEDFRFRLILEKVAYVLDCPHEILFVPTEARRSPVIAWERSRRWLSAWPEAFSKVYENARETTTIYRVMGDARFERAYEGYLASQEEFKRGAWETGLSEVREVLRLDPSLTDALNAFGATCMIERQHLEAGESNLKEAVRLRPEFTLALLNLGRLYRTTNRTGLARECLQKASLSLEKSPEYEYLRPVIEQELRQL